MEKESSFIGKGAEKTVYEHPDDPDKVLGVFHPEIDESAELQKARYYLTRIVRAFYPDLIPAVNQVRTEQKKIEIERVRPKTGAQIGYTQRQMDLIGVRIDLSNFGNLVTDENDVVRYVDTLVPWRWRTDPGTISGESQTRLEFHYNRQQLRNAIEALSGQPSYQEALNSFNRLEDLLQQDYQTHPEAHKPGLPPVETPDAVTVQSLREQLQVLYEEPIREKQEREAEEVRRAAVIEERRQEMISRLAELEPQLTSITEQLLDARSQEATVLERLRSISEKQEESLTQERAINAAQRALEQETGLWQRVTKSSRQKKLAQQLADIKAKQQPLSDTFDENSLQLESTRQTIRELQRKERELNKQIIDAKRYI